MTAGAIVMMTIAMAVLWGGLVAAILNVVRFKGTEPTEPARDL